MAIRLIWVVAATAAITLLGSGLWTFVVHVGHDHAHQSMLRSHQHARFTNYYTDTDVDTNTNDNKDDTNNNNDVYNTCMVDPEPPLGYELSSVETSCRRAVMHRYCNRIAGRVSPLETASPATLRSWDRHLNERYANYSLSPSSSIIAASELRLAYILLTHGEPKQLFRLLGAIYHQHDMYYIHIDANTAIEHINALQHSYWATLTNVQIEIKHRILWGGAGLMWATIDGIRSLLASSQSSRESPQPWHFIVNLSQSDYPLASSTEIRQVLSSRLGSNFMNINLNDDRNLNDGTPSLPLSIND
jgi:hypothetical protein